MRSGFERSEFFTIRRVLLLRNVPCVVDQGPFGGCVVRKFVFRLSRVLRYQQQRQRQAELQLRKATQMLQLAQARRQQLATRLQQATASLDHATGAEFPLTLRINGVHHWSQGERQLQQAQTEIQQAEQALQVASQGWLQIKQKVEALDLLFNQRRQEHRKYANRHAQTELNEMAVNRWSRPLPVAAGDTASQEIRS